MPSIASSSRSSSAKLTRASFGRSRPYELTFWPSSVTSHTPSSASRAISSTSSAGSRLTSRPRVDGTMQKAQPMLQPCEICTHAWNSRSRFIGRWPEKSSNSK